MRCHLLIDADDTLWENNIYFEEAIHDFITFLDHSELTRAEVRGVLDEVERLMGYGAASFTRSLVETYRRLANHEPTEATLRQVRHFGDRIRAQPIKLLDGVAETLDYLQRWHDLILLTKGDTEEQELKVKRSGIETHFQRVIIVPEKRVATYQHLVGELQANPVHTWMIGNSPRSDINPALAAGLNAVFIPHPQTWHLEHEEVQQTGEGRLLMLSSFKELRNCF